MWSTGTPLPSSDSVLILGWGRGIEIDGGESIGRLTDHVKHARTSERWAAMLGPTWWWRRRAFKRQLLDAELSLRPIDPRDVARDRKHVPRGRARLAILAAIPRVTITRALGWKHELLEAQMSTP